MHQTLCAGAFELSANALVKLTQKVEVLNYRCARRVVQCRGTTPFNFRKRREETFIIQKRVVNFFPSDQPLIFNTGVLKRISFLILSVKKDRKRKENLDFL